MNTEQKARTVEVRESDLPLHCPTPETPLWRMHPRVFLDAARTGEVLCPYCGTKYVYKGPARAAH
ncbi:MAG: zinc-finger domain-containing protein [Burkholderiales bacterium]|nr:zinc-finger domain-containing protein [Burkholderiales bacterium]